MDLHTVFSHAPEATPTYQDVLADKRLTEAEIDSEFKKLQAYKPTFDKRCFAGNPILYHYQLDNLCRVKNKAGSFYEMMMDDQKREATWSLINKYAHGSRPNTPATRLFEIYRRMTGAIVFFKPTTAIAVYHHLQATAVLDPCAGWGGRLLGAMATDIDYTGIDTNLDLREAYEGILRLPHTSKATMVWEDALKVDFSTIDYDCVLTSPPYINLEVYPHMDEWKTASLFYTTFLIPLIDKCRKHIRRNGKVCFNISPVMYRELIKCGYDECDETLQMLQQKVRGKDKGDQVYIWATS